MPYFDVEIRNSDRPPTPMKAYNLDPGTFATVYEDSLYLGEEGTLVLICDEGVICNLDVGEATFLPWDDPIDGGVANALVSPIPPGKQVVFTIEE